MSSGSGLPPHEHAPFAVISRLLSCLVTESLLRAYYVPLSTSASAAGVLVVLSTHLISENPILNRVLRSNDVLAIVPLHHPPVLRGSTVYRHGRLVGLLDPLDMMPFVYEFTEDKSLATVKDSLRDEILACLAPPPWQFDRLMTLCRTTDPVALWRKFVDSVMIEDVLREVIEKELSSSLEWQLAAYRNPPKCPSLKSSPIEWEQSLVAGHPTHPMHRARMFPSNLTNYDWYNPRIRFVRVPRSSLDLLGPFDDICRRLVKLAAGRVGYSLSDDGTSVYMPVHELQVPNVLSRFSDVDALPSDVSLPALGQSSIRTVVLPDLPGMTLKLAVGVKISSSLRTISHYTANFGPRFSLEIVPKLVFDRNILAVELEPASGAYRSENKDDVKHFTAVLRKEYEPVDGEILIVSAALLEMDHAGSAVGVSALQHALNLDSDEKRIDFLDKYIGISCRALLPPLIHNGVSLEAHAQNILVRLDSSTGEPLGFVVRDLGGLRIHPDTLRESTGVDFQFIPGHCIITGSVEETYPKFYHTFVHNHIQRLIRVLGLHYDGRGWELLRKHMEAVIPRDHGLWSAWLDPKSTEVPSKCLMRMRMRDSYSLMVYSPFPNMIQYRPQSIEPFPSTDVLK